MTMRGISRALISVYDKSGVQELAQALHGAGVEIVSTGSTATVIEQCGVPVTAVSSVTGFPECLGGRVKTLHPGIHAGILADTRNQDHVQQLRALGIAAFDLVVVNLYPFTATVAGGASNDECIEQIDIGGPAMIRASAKNYASVAVVVSPQSYPEILAALSSGGTRLETRAELAGQAFAHTASYDSAVANWFAAQINEGQGSFPTWQGTTFTLKEELRYGENPHQIAAVYQSQSLAPGIASAEQLHGKPMSYNNYVDADAALRAAGDFVEPAVAIIKHANPCGIAIGLNIADAYAKAHATDPLSAFGGVVASNRVVNSDMAHELANVFTEVLIAPDFEPEALELLREKKNLRILRIPGKQPGAHWESRLISGGMLVQQRDSIDAPGDAPTAWRLVSGQPADSATMRDLEFAWRACRSVKSNAILLAKNQAAVGVGMGQVNRVDSARLAVERAGHRALGSVAASDAFFPFADGLHVLIAAGVSAVVQPGGSMRDEEVIEAAVNAGIVMYFTDTRHFFH